MLRVPGLTEPQRLFDGEPAVSRCATPRGALLTTVTFDDSPLGVPGLSFFHQPSLERALRAALDASAHRAAADRCGRHERARCGRRGAADPRRRRGHHRAVGGRLRRGGEPGAPRAGDRVHRAGRSPSPGSSSTSTARSRCAHLPYFTYLLDPRRPAVNMPRPGGHRFEFMLLPGEDPAAMAAPEQRRAAGSSRTWRR